MLSSLIVGLLLVITGSSLAAPLDASPIKPSPTDSQVTVVALATMSNPTAGISTPARSSPTNYQVTVTAVTAMSDPAKPTSAQASLTNVVDLTTINAPADGSSILANVPARTMSISSTVIITPSFCPKYTPPPAWLSPCEQKCRAEWSWCKNCDPSMSLDCDKEYLVGCINDCNHKTPPKRQLAWPEIRDSQDECATDCGLQQLVCLEGKHDVNYCAQYLQHCIEGCPCFPNCERKRVAKRSCPGECYWHQEQCYEDGKQTKEECDEITEQCLADCDKPSNRTVSGIPTPKRQVNSNCTMNCQASQICSEEGFDLGTCTPGAQGCDIVCCNQYNVNCVKNPPSTLKNHPVLFKRSQSIQAQDCSDCDYQFNTCLFSAGASNTITQECTPQYDQCKHQYNCDSRLPANIPPRQGDANNCGCLDQLTQCLGSTSNVGTVCYDEWIACTSVCNAGPGGMIIRKENDRKDPVELPDSSML